MSVRRAVTPPPGAGDRDGVFMCAEAYRMMCGDREEPFSARRRLRCVAPALSPRSDAGSPLAQPLAACTRWAYSSVG